MNLQEYKRCLNELDEVKLDTLKSIVAQHERIIVLGNGGSNAISCHVAEDYTKILGKKALAFSDTPRLSCYANDYGWENAYLQFLKEFAEPNTLVILISASGNSQNILNCAEYCCGKLPFITLSGFSGENKLRTLYGAQSLLHFYVNNNNYAIVECIHDLILQSVLP